jgi:hypothetical protein
MPAQRHTPSQRTPRAWIRCSAFQILCYLQSAFAHTFAQTFRCWGRKEVTKLGENYAGNEQMTVVRQENISITGHKEIPCMRTYLHVWYRKWQLQVRASSIPYLGSGDRPRSCRVLAVALCQNPCSVLGMRAPKASTIRELVMHVVRNNKNQLWSGLAAKRGFHFRAHKDIFSVLFTSQVRHE